MKIVAYPNRVLRRVSDPMTDFGSELAALVKGMTAAMRAHQGIGLAANQVGVAKRVILVEINKDVLKQRARRTGTDYGKLVDQTIPLTALVNPEIVQSSASRALATEGCLSLPGIEVDVERVQAVKLKAQNVLGKTVKIAAKGLYARVLQHEIDHLNGVLIIDHRTAKEVTKERPSKQTSHDRGKNVYKNWPMI